MKTYHKLYSPVRTNSIDLPSVLVGSSVDTTTITLTKDRETVFHVPSFAASVPLNQAQLQLAGATAGYTPAVSDRIYKFRGDYGNNTPSGNTIYETDGVWYCSWLKREADGNHRWYDRIFQPGSFVYNEDLDELLFAEQSTQFIDIPTRMVLEPGTWYRYFHAGDESYLQAKTRFAGEDRSRLTLQLSAWSSGGADSSNYNNAVRISGFTESATVPPVNSIFSLPGGAIKCNEVNSVEVPYNQNYVTDTDTTWSLWAYSNDWDNNTDVQLIGNHTARGGMGAFFQPLSTVQHFFVGETAHGHLFGINNEFAFFADYNAQTIFSISATPEFIAADPIEQSTLVVDTTPTNTWVYKIDASGDKIAMASVDGNRFRFTLTEQVLFAGIGPSRQIYISTTEYDYLFDPLLNLVNSTAVANTSATAFGFDENGAFLKQVNAKDVKVCNGRRWVVTASGTVTVDGQSLLDVSSAQALFVAPDNTKVWIACSPNIVKVVDSTTLRVIKILEVGTTDVDDVISGGFVRKNTNWSFVLVGSNKKSLFSINANTYVIERILDLTAGGATSGFYESLSQQSESFRFTAKGDLTGSEYIRIFRRLEFNSSAQLVVKTTTERASNEGTTPYVTLLTNVVSPLRNKTWNHVCLKRVSNKIELLVNGISQTTLTYTGNLLPTTDFQPPLFIGSSNSKTSNLNTLLRINDIRLNGWLADVEIYNYALTAEQLEILQKAKYRASDMIWNLPAPPLSIVEEITKLYKHRLPGSKSQFFNIRINNSGITDRNLQLVVEEQIRETLKDYLPSYTVPLNFLWDTTN